MAKVLITESTLEDIADAIRVKANTNRTYKPSEMAAAINNLEDEEHQPAHINIAQTNNQTITVNANLFSASEVQTEHTTSFTVNVPSSVQLNASVTPDTGYAAGELNIANTVLSWGNTANFNAVAPTRLSPTVTYNVLSAQPVSLGNVNVKYIFTGPSVAEVYNLTDNRTISVPTLNNNETYEQIITYYVTEADIFEGSVDISITNAASGITTSITLETEDPISQLTIARNGSSNNSIVITNTGNLTLYGISVDCANDGKNITYASIAPGENQVITLDNLTYTFETVSVEATSPDPDSPNYTLEQTIYFNPTVIDLNNYLNVNLNGSYRQSSTLPDSVIKELTNKIITNVGPGAFGSTVYIDEEGPDYDDSETYSNLTTLSGVEKTWDMSQLTSIQCMFCGCSNLHDINISNWNVSNVIDMSHFLNACYLPSIDVSNWNTGSVQNMELMFAFNMFTSLDLSNWNTANVTNIISLFEACDALQILDMSNWDTRNIIDSPNSNTHYLPTGMSQMFVGCDSLQYLIIGSEEFKFVMKDEDIGNLNNTCKILVPSALLNTYKTATNWSSRASQFYAIENYTITRFNGQVTVTPNS